jgi:aminopeptidase N
MEHQSSVTYGNEYKKGMKGRDHTGTGWGTKFDFIIIHESGHEWFANNITNQDVADMWIHESFTTYSESIFVEYYYGKEAASEYIRGVRMSIANEYPLISSYGVNDESEDSDMYYKGTNILNTLRQVVNDDAKWKAMFKALNTSFYHQTVTTKEIEGFISAFFDLDLTAFFDQYLRDNRVPVFEYRFLDGVMVYRWTNCIETFDMPLKVKVDGKWLWLQFDNPYGLNQISLVGQEHTIEFDPNFYVYTQNVMGE